MTAYAPYGHNRIAHIHSYYHVLGSKAAREGSGKSHHLITGRFSPLTIPASPDGAVRIRNVTAVETASAHGSSRVTLGIYAQAQMPAKRAAQQTVVAMVRKPTADVTPQPGVNCSPKCSAEKLEKIG